MKFKKVELDPCKLIVSETHQARKTAGTMPLAQLADSIAEVGLIHPLAVVKSKKRGYHEVVAGGRRLQAITILIKDGRWSVGQLVECNLYAEDAALLVSITENVQREQMHPADEFESFAKLISQGKTIEDVAAAFGVTATVVRRRLRLGRVAPVLMQAYRKDELSTDALMAYALTDDQALQVQIYEALGRWDRNSPYCIRHRLMDNATTADDRLVRFVGLEAYQAAGGNVRRDLFADEDKLDGIHLTDVPLLEQLALAKLQEQADKLLQEGWLWAEVTTSTESTSDRYGRVYAQPVELTPELQAQYDALELQAEALTQKMDALEEQDGDEAEWQTLDEQRDELHSQMAKFDDLGHEHTAAQMQISGCIVKIDYQGRIGVSAGLIRPEDREQAQQAQQDTDDEVGRVSLPAVKTRPMHSERLVRQLTANKTAIVQAALANNVNIALAVLVAHMARGHFGEGYYRHSGYGLGISTSCETLTAHAPDVADSRAGQELERIGLHWGDVVPGGTTTENGQILTWALAQETDTLLELLAYLVATTVQGVQHHESTQATPLDRLAALLELDMAEWWSATGETYLNHVSKDRIIHVVSQGASPEQAAPLAQMKKKQASEAAEQVLASTGWLPAIMTISQDSVSP